MKTYKSKNSIFLNCIFKNSRIDVKDLLFLMYLYLINGSNALTANLVNISRKSFIQLK